MLYSEVPYELVTQAICCHGGRTKEIGEIQTNGQWSAVSGTDRVTVAVAAAAAEAPRGDGNEIAVANKSVLPKK